jgi:hypothetical protein
MKKWLSIFFAMCFIVSFVSCGRVDGTEATDKTEEDISEIDTDGFARVMESSERSLLVCGFSSLGYAYVSLPRDIKGEDFQVGDYVKITYGGVCETYPVSVSAITIRHLTEEETAAVYKEQTVCGEYIGMNENGVFLCHDLGMYIVPVENLENAPRFVEGMLYEVVYDGIRFDRMLGCDEKIYFPISITCAEEYAELQSCVCCFTAEIRKITNTYLEVYTQDEHMRRTSDLFRVSMPDGVDADDFSIGDVVEIAFSGAIEELYPANIQGTVSIVRCTED